MKPQTEKSYRESGIQPVGLKSEGLTLNLRATCSTKIVHSRQYVVRSSDGVQFIGEMADFLDLREFLHPFRVGGCWLAVLQRVFSEGPGYRCDGRGPPISVFGGRSSALIWSG